MKLGKTDLAIGLLVTIVWGCNFSVIELGLETLDPHMLTLLRFVFCALPLVFFVKRPQGVSWSVLAAYGVLFGVGLGWGLNFAIHHGLSPGMSSVLLQFSAFFTILLSSAFLGEKISAFHTGGMLFAVIGLLLILLGGGQASTVIGIALVMLAALGWACCNVLVKVSKPADMMAFVIWSSVFSVPAILLLMVAEKGLMPFAGLADGLTGKAVFSVLFQSYVTTILGYWCWNCLMKKYAAVQIAPLSLMVPVSGLIASAVMFGERLSGQQALAIGFILLGIVVFLNAGSLQALLGRRRLPRGGARSHW